MFRAASSASPAVIRSTTAVLGVLALLGSSGGEAFQKRSARSSEAFTRLVDEYLDDFARRHPSIAAGNGLHQHDGLLEDFSAIAVEQEVSWLRLYRTRLDGIDPERLSPDERVDHRILSGIVDGWLLDLTTVRTWQRNPMIYAAAVSDGLHNLMTLESSPTDARLRDAIAKLRAVPALVASARANLADPPAVFVARGAGMFRAAASLIERDLPLRFANAGDDRLRAQLREVSLPAIEAVTGFARHLETQVLPRARGDFAIGSANLQARYRAEELIDLDAIQVAAIGERELEKTQAEFRATAARIAPDRDALAVWADVLRDHPARGQLVEAAQRTVDDLLRFIEARRLVDLPAHDRVIVASAPDFDLGLASMHASPPLEPRPVKSFYYLSDARADWPPERQDAWLQKFNHATLAVVSAHEVYPGHFTHSLFMRRTPGKIRRIWIGLNPFPQPSSGQDGWAHYAEQMIVDEGYKTDDARYKLAQVSEALTRIVRAIAGVRLHTRAWDVDQAATFFETQAHLPPPAARQEAERGTYDPTYGGYFLGKLAALKLRKDYAAERGRRFDLRDFHERVMSNGIAPWWAHRQLLMRGDTRPVIE